MIFSNIEWLHEILIKFSTFQNGADVKNCEYLKQKNSLLSAAGKIWSSKQWRYIYKNISRKMMNNVHRVFSALHITYSHGTCSFNFLK